jgi:hypothetical protein
MMLQKWMALFVVFHPLIHQNYCPLRQERIQRRVDECGWFSDLGDGN